MKNDSKLAINLKSIRFDQIHNKSMTTEQESNPNGNISTDDKISKQKNTDNVSGLPNAVSLHDLYEQLKSTYSEVGSDRCSNETPKPPLWVARPHMELSEQHNWNIRSDNSFFNRETVTQRYSMRVDAILCSLAFNSDGTCFAYADSHHVFLLRSQDGSLVNTWEIPPTIEKTSLQTRIISFSPDSRFLGLGVSSDKILLIELGSDSQPIVLSGHAGQVTSLLYNMEKNLLLSGGYDGYLCSWNLNQYSLVRVIKHRPEQAVTNKGNVEGKIVALSETTDKKFVAVGFMDGAVGIYESTFTSQMMKFTAHEKYLFDLSISKLVGLLATSSADFSIRLWHLNAVAVCQKTLRGHRNIVMTVCFSTLDPILFTGSKDEMIAAWDIDSGLELFRIEFHDNTVFKIIHHPTKRSILSCSGDGMISMWDYELEDSKKSSS